MLTVTVRRAGLSVLVGLQGSPTALALGLCSPHLTAVYGCEARRSEARDLDATGMFQCEYECGLEYSV
jgi:hypothetical protein